MRGFKGPLIVRYQASQNINVDYTLKKIYILDKNAMQKKIHLFYDVIKLP